MQVCRFLLYCISGIEGNSRTLKILEGLNIRVKFTQGRVSDGWYQPQATVVFGRLYASCCVVKLNTAHKQGSLQHKPSIPTDYIHIQRFHTASFMCKSNVQSQCRQEYGLYVAGVDTRIGHTCRRSEFTSLTQPVLAPSASNTGVWSAALRLWLWQCRCSSGILSWPIPLVAEWVINWTSGLHIALTWVKSLTQVQLCNLHDIMLLF